VSAPKAGRIRVAGFHNVGRRPGSSSARDPGIATERRGKLLVGDLFHRNILCRQSIPPHRFTSCPQVLLRTAPRPKPGRPGTRRPARTRAAGSAPRAGPRRCRTHEDTTGIS